MKTLAAYCQSVRTYLELPLFYVIASGEAQVGDPESLLQVL